MDGSPHSSATEARKADRARPLRWGVGAVVLALVLAAGGSAAARTPPRAPLATPTKKAKMVCAREAQHDIAGVLAIKPAAVTKPTWANQLYSCTYQYPTGSFTLSVKQLADRPATVQYFNALGAFLNRLPDDEFWAAKQVMAFTEDEIRTIVKVAQYSNPASERYVADTIIARRDKIGREYFPKVLPLDQFAVENGSLIFHDLAQEHAMEAKGPLHVAWSSFDNSGNQKSPLPAAQDFQVPADSSSGYLAADIWRGDDRAKSVTVYLRRSGTAPEVVGIDRNW